MNLFEYVLFHVLVLYVMISGIAIMWGAVFNKKGGFNTWQKMNGVLVNKARDGIGGLFVAFGNGIRGKKKKKTP